MSPNRGVPGGTTDRELGEHETRLDRLESQVNENHTRITSLEHARTWVIGSVAMLTLVAGLLASAASSSILAEVRSLRQDLAAPRAKVP